MFVPPRAALGPIGHGHVRRVRQEVGLPHPPLVHRSGAGGPPLIGRQAVREHVGVVPDEVGRDELAQHPRQVGDRDHPRGLGAAAVEVLIPRVHRDGEVRPLRPLEGLLLGLVVPDGGRPAAAQDVDDLVVHVVIGVGLAGRADLQDVLVGLLVAVEVDHRAVAPLARPVVELQLVEVLDVEPPVDLRPLILLPVLIGVDALEDRGVRWVVVRRHHSLRHLDSGGVGAPGAGLSATVSSPAPAVNVGDSFDAHSSRRHPFVDSPSSDGLGRDEMAKGPGAKGIAGVLPGPQCAFGGAISTGMGCPADPDNANRGQARGGLSGVPPDRSGGLPGRRELRSPAGGIGSSRDSPPFHIGQRTMYRADMAAWKNQLYFRGQPPDTP